MYGEKGCVHVVAGCTYITSLLGMGMRRVGRWAGHGQGRVGRAWFGD